MSDMKCPFCNKKLELDGTSGQFQCVTWGCDASLNFIATRDVWEYIERTRKVLEKAKLILKNLLPDLDGYERLDVEKVLKEITTMEQKD